MVPDPTTSHEFRSVEASTSQSKSNEAPNFITGQSQHERWISKKRTNPAVLGDDFSSTVTFVVVMSALANKLVSATVKTLLPKTHSPDTP